MNDTTLDPLTILLLKQYQPDKLESIEKQQYKAKIKKALRASDTTVNALIEGNSLEEIKALSDALSFDGMLSKSGITSILERYFPIPAADDVVDQTRDMSVKELIAFLSRNK